MKLFLVAAASLATTAQAASLKVDLSLDFLLGKADGVAKTTTAALADPEVTTTAVKAVATSTAVAETAEHVPFAGTAPAPHVINPSPLSLQDVAFDSPTRGEQLPDHVGPTPDGSPAPYVDFGQNVDPVVDPVLKTDDAPAPSIDFDFDEPAESHVHDTYDAPAPSVRNPTPLDLRDDAGEQSNTLLRHGPAPVPSPAPLMETASTTKIPTTTTTSTTRAPVKPTTTTTTAERVNPKPAYVTPEVVNDPETRPPQEEEHRHDNADVATHATTTHYIEQFDDHSVVTDPFANHHIGDMNGVKPDGDVDPIDDHQDPELAPADGSSDDHDSFNIPPEVTPENGFVVADGPGHELEMYDPGRYVDDDDTLPATPPPEELIVRPTASQEWDDMTGDQLLQLYTQHSDMCCSREQSQESQTWKIGLTVNDDGQECAKTCARSFNNGQWCTAFEISYDETLKSAKCYLFYNSCSDEAEMEVTKNCDTYTFTQPYSTTQSTTDRADRVTTTNDHERRQVTTTNDHDRRETTTNDRQRHRRATTTTGRERRDENDGNDGAPRRATTTGPERRGTTTYLRSRRETTTVDVGYRYIEYFDRDEILDCSKGEQDEETMDWSNVVYSSQREYYQYAAGFEPEDRSDCYQACEAESECNFFWYESSLPDPELTTSGKYCILHKSCDETRTPGWPGTAYEIRRE